MDEAAERRASNAEVHQGSESPSRWPARQERLDVRYTARMGT